MNVLLMNIQYSIGSKEPITETESDQTSPNEIFTSQKANHRNCLIKKCLCTKWMGKSVSEKCVSKSGSRNGNTRQFPGPAVAIRAQMWRCQVKMSEVIMSELKMPTPPNEIFQLLILYSVIIYLINMAEFSSLYTVYSQAEADVHAYSIHNLSSFIFPG